MSQLRRDSSELSVGLGRVYDSKYIARNKQILNIYFRYCSKGQFNECVLWTKTCFM